MGAPLRTLVLRQLILELMADGKARTMKQIWAMMPNEFYESGVQSQVRNFVRDGKLKMTKRRQNEGYTIYEKI